MAYSYTLLAFLLIVVHRLYTNMKFINYTCRQNLSLLCYDVFKCCGGSVQIYMQRKTFLFYSVLGAECFVGALCCLAFSFWNMSMGR